MQNRQQGRQLATIGVVIIVLVLGVGFFLMNRGGGSGSAGATASATQPVLVASQSIPQGTIFKYGQSVSPYFTIQQEPKNLVPFGAYTNVAQVQNLTKVAGCGPVLSAGCQGEVTTTQTLYQGSPIVSGMFTALGQYRTSIGPSYAIPSGYVAIAVGFDAVNSVLGSINPGDTIDLIASWRNPSPKFIKPPSQTQYALTNLRVISVNSPPSVSGGSSSSSSSTPAGTTSTGAPTAGALVLLVRFQQALVIQHLKDFGWSLSSVLLPARATAIKHFKTTPVSNDWYFFKQDNPYKAFPGYPDAVSHGG